MLCKIQKTPSRNCNGVHEQYAFLASVLRLTKSCTVQSWRQLCFLGGSFQRQYFWVSLSNQDMTSSVVSAEASKKIDMQALWRCRQRLQPRQRDRLYRGLFVEDAVGFSRKAIDQMKEKEHGDQNESID